MAAGTSSSEGSPQPEEVAGEAATPAAVPDAGQGPSRRSRRPSHRRRWWVLGGVAALVVALAGYAAFQYHSLDSGIRRSSALAGAKQSTHGDTNLLVMGLDSRLDENGDPLPKAMYDALHTGDASIGGLNTNVLMLVHIPGDGSRATAISIPRDDYVDFAGCPDGECKGKIKEAYGLAYDQEQRKLAKQGITGHAANEPAREAGRKTEIATVQQFLGGVPIDHFVEVTMVAFYQIAQNVQPIQVCVKEDTQDTFSGANFHAGLQQINASQAMAFVRQRRDTVHPDLQFTDLDRSRRQQAFIASLFHQMKQANTFVNPATISGLINVAKQNTAMDAGLDPLELAREASALSGGNLHFFTLPVQRFGFDKIGQSVNIVDVPLIRSTVHAILSTGNAPAAPATPKPSATTTPTTSVPDRKVDVINESGVSGQARQVLDAAVAKGARPGLVSSGIRRSSSVVDYAPGDSAAAQSLADFLGGLQIRERASTPAGSLIVRLGNGFILPASASPTPGSTATTPAPPPATAVSAVGGGRSGPPPTALTDLSGGGIPCVK